MYTRHTVYWAHAHRAREAQPCHLHPRRNPLQEADRRRASRRAGRRAKLLAAPLRSARHDGGDLASTGVHAGHARLAAAAAAAAAALLAATAAHPERAEVVHQQLQHERPPGARGVQRWAGGGRVGRLPGGGRRLRQARVGVGGGELLLALVDAHNQASVSARGQDGPCAVPLLSGIQAVRPWHARTGPGHALACAHRPGACAHRP